MADRLNSLSLISLAQYLYTGFHGDVGQINTYLDNPEHPPPEGMRAIEVPWNLIDDVKRLIRFLSLGNRMDEIDVYDLLTQLGLFRTLFGKLDTNSILSFAALRGHRNIVNEAVARGASDFNNAMGLAAGYGHRDIVVDMIARGANYFDMAMAQAARGGHRQLVLDLARGGSLTGDRGSTDFNGAMVDAAEGGYRDIVADMMACGANDFDTAMAQAAWGGHRQLVLDLARGGSLAGDRGSTDFRWAMDQAELGGYRDIVADMRARIGN